jgi:hypothetical protein
MFDLVERPWEKDLSSALSTSSEPEAEAFAMGEAALARAAEYALSTLARCEHVRVSPVARTIPGGRVRLDILIRAQAEALGDLPALVAHRLAAFPLAYRLIISCRH